MTTTNKTKTNAQIRNHLGHNGSECKVVIHRDGTVTRYGSTDDSDRSNDYWAYCGTIDEITDEIAREEG